MTPVYSIKPIGTLHSPLKDLQHAPRQGFEDAPSAELEIDAEFQRAAEDIEVGDEIIVITWLHLAERDVLAVHPRDERGIPLTGVFSTRSPARPNPLGLHPVTVLRIEGLRLTIGPIEAVDGTPVVDIKPVI
jgi:tRNA-Thr(GGU) m(6)t(6)A37 methyltransferase TsaA